MPVYHRHHPPIKGRTAADTESLGQSQRLLAQSGRAQLVETFRSEVTSSLEGVIKDLGSDPATKTTARDLKTALNNLEGGKEKESSPQD